MREFKAGCMDPVTRCEIVLSDSSYNMACAYLESKIGMDEKVEVSVRGGLIFLKYTDKRLKFCYNESRGCLLKVC